MEIPVINRIRCSHNEALNHLNMNHTSSFISRVFHFMMGIEEISIQIYNLWAWGALILAAIATSTGGINRARLLIFRLWKGNSVISNPLLQPYDDDDYDDEDDDSSSSVCSSDDEDGDKEEEEEEENQEEPVDEDFRVAGYGNYSEDKGQIRKRKFYRQRSSKNRFSWADFTNGKSVVKLWEGLGLGFESCSETVISMLDLNRNEITNSFLLGGSNCQIPAVTAISPAVIMSGGFEKGNRKAALRVWDARTGRQIPEAIAEWIPHRRSNQMGIDSDGLGMVYVSDDVSALETTIRDLRKIESPLEESCWTEFDGKKKTFWEWEEL